MNSWSLLGIGFVSGIGFIVGLQSATKNLKSEINSVLAFDKISPKFFLEAW